MSLVWSQILAHLSVRVTRQNFETYFVPTAAHCWDLDGRTIVATAPNADAADWLSTRMRNVINQAVAAVIGPEYDVRFLARDSPGT